MPFVSRGGIKLDHAIAQFGLDVTGRVCADLGCSTGGFTDCLLQRGAARVYAVDTGYGVLEYTLRRDPRVVVMERTNAMHLTLPEPIDLVTIDAGWTRQKHILPNARRLLRGVGVPTAESFQRGVDASPANAPDASKMPVPHVITLIKPHYESEPADLIDGILPEEKIEPLLVRVQNDIATAGFEVVGTVMSPIKGQKGNAELLALLRRAG